MVLSSLALLSKLLVSLIIVMAPMQSMELNPIEMFVIDYLSHYLKLPVPDFHREMYDDAYRLIERGQFKYLLEEAPRSFGKSTIFSIAVPLYCICECEYPEMMTVSRDIKLSRKWLRFIKKELLTNELLIQDYGIRKGKEWQKDYFEYKRGDGFEGTFISMSLGMSPRGWRPQLAIIDDPEKGKDARSQTIRESNWEWFTEDFYGMLEADTPLIFIGTRVHPLCLLAKAAKLYNWNHKKFQAVDIDGKSIWPQKWPIEKLMERRKIIGDKAFNAEYQNNPIVSENPIFEEDWFNSYEMDSRTFKQIKRDGLYIVTMVDPAISKKDNADCTAIVTKGATYDRYPDIYTLEVKQGHWSLRDTIREVFLTYENFNQRKTLVETVAYQKALADELRLEQEASGLRIGITDVERDKDKERRAHVVSPLYQNGQQFIDYTDRMQKLMMEQMIMFPDDEHDDMCDASVGCDEFFREWMENRSSRRQDTEDDDIRRTYGE